MKALLVLLLLLSCKPKATKDTVLICNSKTAKSYHLDYCMGLKECNHNVIEMTKQEAISKGRKECKFCFKK